MPFRRTSIDSNQRTGFYSPKRSRVVGSRVVTDFDPNAFAYLSAVETADGQALEYDVKVAVNNFVIGCKADGIWTAIKASCILAGARTLSGALVPLIGTAPTNNNFVSGDYNRETGLVGDGSTKYLDSNRNNNVDPQDSRHLSIYVSTASSIVNFARLIQAGVGNNGSSFIVTSNFSPLIVGLSTNAGSISSVLNSQTQFIGISRIDSTNLTCRGANTSASLSNVSQSPVSGNYFIIGKPAEQHSNSRLAFYSIGESLDLALLDTRVTTLINAIAAAIP